MKTGALAERSRSSRPRCYRPPRILPFLFCSSFCFSLKSLFVPASTILQVATSACVCGRALSSFFPPLSFLLCSASVCSLPPSLSFSLLSMSSVFVSTGAVSRATLLVLLLCLLLVPRTARAQGEPGPSTREGSGGGFNPPGWALALIVLGGVAIIAAVVVPIGCLCRCGACENRDDRDDPEAPHPSSKGGPDTVPTHPPQSTYFISGQSPMSGTLSRGSAPAASKEGDHQWSYNTPTSDALCQSFTNGYQTPRAAPASTRGLPSPTLPPMSSSQRYRLRRLSDPATADPEFGSFVSEG